MKLGDIDGVGLICGFSIGTLLIKYIELTCQIIIPVWMALPFFVLLSWMIGYGLKRIAKSGFEENGNG